MKLPRTIPLAHGGTLDYVRTNANGWPIYQLRGTIATWTLTPRIVSHLVARVGHIEEWAA